MIPGVLNMSRVIFHELRDLADALNLALSLVNTLPTEIVSIKRSLGRILAEDIRAPISLPPFDRSSVDGYAVRSPDIASADEHKPIKLRLKGHVKVGETPRLEVNDHEAIEVDTGAAIPPGADSVVMEEYTSRENENTIIVYRSTSPGENVFYTGTDVMKDELVLTRGTRIGIKEISILSSLGINKVKVYMKPRIAIISTGRELIPPGSSYVPFKIYDTNSYMIYSFLTTLGCHAEILGIIPDDYDKLSSSIMKACEFYDLIITSGGTSAGKEDIVYRVLNDIGNIIVHGLRTRPGKPTLIALVNKKLVIGLPGHPVSAFMIMHVLVRPIVLKMMGCRRLNYPYIRAKLSRKLVLRKGYLNIIPVALIRVNDGFIAYPTFKGSGLLSSIIPADGFIEVEGNKEFLPANTWVEVKLFSDKISLPDLTFIGSHCLVTDKILSSLEMKGFLIRRIYVGSLEGLKACIRGEADIAGIHLLHEDSGQYNVPFIKLYGAEDKVVLIRGFKRRQGLVVAKGNPKSITNLKDILTRNDIRFVNRNKGSGTRILLDILLRSICKEEGIDFNSAIKRIKGYSWEVFTHTAVASAILHGKADVGIAVEYVARLMGLDFIPIAVEQYDYVIPRSKLSTKPVQQFLAMLKAIKNNLRLPGVEFTEDSGEIIEI